MLSLVLVVGMGVVPARTKPETVTVTVDPLATRPRSAWIHGINGYGASFTHARDRTRVREARRRADPGHRARPTQFLGGANRPKPVGFVRIDLSEWCIAKPGYAIMTLELTDIAADSPAARADADEYRATLGSNKVILHVPATAVGVYDVQLQGRDRHRHGSIAIRNPSGHDLPPRGDVHGSRRRGIPVICTERTGRESFAIV